ncbi:MULTISPECIES: DNA-processing protein DprA [unclassified Mycolicibacterium]|uniref:DNA-processing protein DprA n=1 Tax=unclassified Mycolicibacterium TaxID=2636767 RepID=UPI0012DEC357|nr:MULTISPECIES: DNA-processing protein DprA [unclassified Mycolicibacterium]MUL80503.1 DNA-protecting protein DprA [Mycolicibacterium sp. CBMA 329]MUL86270.1 DNA-protecting protein DprA [Mycolicibacterium sp. CBMA 331]MUM01068.1 DNA-protecting protein DprA [Mycolicibacterium sp. CBMA 334]MUM24962.1 DNA-protecting protein DprA [Mycolicibacterium sp. CBMA 295]MUM36566.1 DNA-protecting protein DprA [Mycolicibacterium sp. CBMA 247]
MTDEVRRAWAYLSRVAEPPCQELSAFVGQVGPVEAAGRAKSGDVESSLLRRIEARRELDCAVSDLDVLDRMGGRLITPDDDEWPLLQFRAFSGEKVRKRGNGHPPLVLWASGPARLDEVSGRAASVVGTRAATAYGEHVAAELAAGLAERDVTVVSGGAYGIDGAAHRAALACEGVTVAIVAGGIDNPYPSGHSALFHRIRQECLLVSEYPPGVAPGRLRFLTRNRLVAALSGATVVVEAGLRSGAANTAAWARLLGRSVCAVPGPVTSAASAGCHALLRDGAALVGRAEQVVELVGHIGELAPEESRPVGPLDGLAPAEKRVYDAFPARGAHTVDEIAMLAALLPHQVLGPLTMLELNGLVESVDGCWRIVRRRRARGAAVRSR